METGKLVMNCKARWLIRATGQDRAGGQLTLSRVTRPSRSDICARPRGAGRIWAMKQWPREKGIQESQAETRSRGRRERQGEKLSGYGALITKPVNMGLITWVGKREPTPGREEET